MVSDQVKDQASDQVNDVFAPFAAAAPAKVGHVAIVGAGPAGLIAAEILASAGHRVTVFDRMPSPARKLLMAGRGGLNLTHSEPLEAFLGRYRATVPPVLETALRTFPPAHLISWAESLGQETFVGSSGRVFPKTMKASPLLRAWLQRLQRLGVEFKLRQTFTGFLDQRTGLGFTAADGSQTNVTTDAVILGMGGATWPRLGSDGGWVEPLRHAGLNITPQEPSNAAVRIPWSADFAGKHHGQPLKRIAVTVAGERRRGEAVITRHGLEGGVIYTLNPALRRATLSAPADLIIDLRPDETHEALAQRLSKPRAKMSAATFLRKAVALAPAAIGLLRESAGGPLPADAGELARLIKSVRLMAGGLAGVERAISTAGGLGVPSLDEHLMLKSRPGVFAAGEMLDWDAPTGGYLLQMSFSTGVLAARGALQWLTAVKAGGKAVEPCSEDPGR